MNWLSRHGPRYWLGDPRWYVRAIRVSLVLAVLGSASASLTTACLLVQPFSIFVAPGLWFGIVTLIPLSRWLGRGWILTLLAVPVSVVANLCGVFAYLDACSLFGKVFGDFARALFGETRILFDGFFGGFVGALIVSAWMGNLKQRQSWIAGFCATAFAALGCGFGRILHDDIRAFAGSHWDPLAMSGFARFVIAGLLFYTFQCVVPVCLGARLWFPMSTRETAANKPKDSGSSPSVVIER